jgi:fumarate reductase flavoprotein subunit
MARLYAVGEASCWDMHGFNRLGGNSLAETLVAGRVVGMNIAAKLTGDAFIPDAGLAAGFLDRTRERIRGWLERDGQGPTVYEIRDRLAETMIGKLGVFRTGSELEAAVNEIRGLIADCDRATLRTRAAGMNPELSFALRLTGMLRLSLITAMGAVARTESRGAHFRTDYPLRNDKDWLSRTLARWPVGRDAPELTYEPVGLLDLPPGHRGYGADKRVEMELSLEDYNASVETAQVAHGKLSTRESMGTRLKPGAWHGAFGAPQIKTGEGA